MHRFAYPNVIPHQSKAQFIGCGRYKAMPSERAGTEDSVVKDGPETPDLSHLRRSIEILAPDSYDSEKIIFEKKDRPDRIYRGNSADLAWLLAHINRARSLIFPNLSHPGDIWCTGIVKFKEQTQTSILSEVDSKGFRIKLSAFLAEENRDKLFIAPTANVDDHELEQIIKDKNAELLSLTQFNASDKNSACAGKTIIKVLSNEIPALIDLFFEHPSQKKPDRKKEKTRRPSLIGIVTLLLLLFGGWLIYEYWDGVSPHQVIDAVENGEFALAAKLMEKASTEHAEFSLLREMLDHHLNLTLKFEYRPSDDSSAPILSQDFTETLHTILNHTHDYRLLITASAATMPLYLYVYQEDWRGKVDPLFPNPVWNPGQNNPLRPAEFPYYIPADANGWFYMDKLSSTAAMKTALETVYVIASPWKAKDIEKAYGEIHLQTDPAIHKTKLARFVERLKLRHNSGFKCFYFGSFSFTHG
jgi:hypothetical protein